ncbi:MAG: flagellar hook-length control protein FliK [Pseudomonadota bacterium]
MDITNLTQNLIKGLEQKNTEQLVTLSQLLKIALGKIVMASVTETTPVTPQEKDALLAKTIAALAQNNKLASNIAQLTPALKAEITRLLDQQTLIKSPELKWVTLLVNNQPLLTYTDKPLAVGQTVPLQLVGPQKLVALEMPGALAINNEKVTINTLNTLSTSIEKSAPKPESLLPQPFTNTLKYSNTQQLIANNLRYLLPHKDTPSVLLTALTQWQNIPKTNQQQLVSPTLAQALKSAAEQIRSPLQLSQPTILKQAISSSGVFFENKISKHLTNTTTTLNSTYAQDLKGSLLNLFSKVSQELNGNNKPLTTEQTVKLLQQLISYIPTAGTTTALPGDSVKNSLPIDIGLFIQQLMGKPVKELSDKDLRTQLLVLLQQHSMHSLAKIQLQQLANLNHEVNSKDGAQSNAVWQLDIPVRHHNEVQQLHLHMEREWVEDKNTTNENKTATKIKQWSVTLRFDLPTLGEFCAQLAIIDTTISATLWATRETTFTQVKQHMESLRKNLETEGIQVKQLQCMKGMPPQKPMALSYSLIDIST